MATPDPTAEEAFRVALGAVEAAWEAGCPVAGSNPVRRAEVARRAVRRWGSAARRGVPPGAKDLAAGLIAAFEPEPKVVGPLACDYEHLASCIAAALQGRRPDA
jgi:hypothetical protein